MTSSRALHHEQMHAGCHQFDSSVLEANTYSFAVSLAQFLSTLTSVPNSDLVKTPAASVLVGENTINLWFIFGLLVIFC